MQTEQGIARQLGSPARGARQGISLKRIGALVLTLLALGAAWLLGEHHGSSQQLPVQDHSAMIPVYSRQLRVAILPLYAAGDADVLGHEWYSADALADLQTGLAVFFPFTYEVVDPRELPADCFNPQTKQYMTDRILDWLKAIHDPLYYRTIGITPEDVSDADHNFLFGQALIGGQVCVASNRRITGSEEYTREKRQEMWHAIVGHELGHTLGLPHIEDRRSLMCYANSLAEHAATGTQITASEWRYLKRVHNIAWQAE